MDIFSKDATAMVEVRGIGIAAFCKTHDRFQESMIRNSRHKFALVVDGPVTLEDGSVEGEIVREIPEFDDVEISIDTIGRPETVGWRRHEPGEFNRLLPENDPNDIRWVLDLEKELHGYDLVKNTAIKPAEKPSLSRVSINNAYFFSYMTKTADRKKIPYFFRVEGGVMTPFGFLAESYGARMKAEAVVVTLKRGEKTEVFTINHNEGSPQNVRIWNVDPGTDSEVSDFPEIMKLLADPNERNVSLVPWKPFVKGASPYNDTTYCHTSSCPSDCPHSL